MTAHVMPHARTAGSSLSGTLTLTLGILFAAAVVFAYPSSLSGSVNPPDRVRGTGPVRGALS